MKDSRPGTGDRPGGGQSSTLYSEIFTQHGASSRPRRRLVGWGISMPSVSVAGGVWVIGRMPANNGIPGLSITTTRQAGRSLPESRPVAESDVQR